MRSYGAGRTAAARRRIASGFTAVELVVVLIIVGLLLAMAAPNWVRARQSTNAKTCVSNLARIDAAERQWALDNKKSDGATVTLSTDLVGSTKYLSRVPTCPSGGTYSPTMTVGTVPTCTIGTNGTAQTYDDHVLNLGS